MLGNCDAADAGKPAGATPGRYFGNDCRIEICDGAFGEAGPDLIHSQKWYPKVAADSEPPTIRADRHHGVVHVAVARVENVAILISQSAALHVPDERDAEHRRIPAVIHASGADRMELVLGPRKNLGDDALIDPIVLHEQKPTYRPTGLIQLLPQTRGGGLS